MMPPLALTSRQFDVVRGLLRGESYKQIAQSLGITRSTVRLHVRAIAARIEGDDPPVRRVLRFAQYFLEPSRPDADASCADGRAR